MRALAITEYGARLKELQLPEPELQPGYAIVAVDACGVCQSDVKVSRGRMPFSPNLALPHVPGHEIAGRVVACEPKQAIELATRVLVIAHLPCRRCSRCVGGQPQLCLNLDVLGFTRPGGFQERITVPLENLVLLPPELDTVRAAPIGCALGTAYRATVTRGGVRPGMSVAVLGLGGVGIHALQIAQLAAATCVGLDISPSAIGAAHALGLDARSVSDHAVEREIINELGDGEGFDLVIDAVGHPTTLDQASRLVRKGGRLVVVGYMLESPFSIPSHRLALDELEVLGSRNVTRPELDQVIRLVASGKLEVVVQRVEPLARLNEVLDDVESGRVAGRTVMRVDG